MSDEQIKRHLKEYAERYDGIITAVEASAIAKRSVKTIYHWSSTKRLDEIKGTQPGTLLLDRDGFVLFVLTGSVKPIP